MRPCDRATVRPCDRATMRPCDHATVRRWRCERICAHILRWVKWGKNTTGGGVFYTGLGRFWRKKATFLASTRNKKRGDATIFRGGSCREGLAEIRGDVRVGRGFLCRGRAFLHGEKTVARSHGRTVAPPLRRARAIYIIYGNIIYKYNI